MYNSLRFEYTEELIEECLSECLDSKAFDGFDDTDHKTSALHIS